MWWHMQDDSKHNPVKISMDYITKLQSCYRFKYYFINQCVLTILFSFLYVSCVSDT